MESPNFYFVKYVLYGMSKNIIFQGLSQYENWRWALERLNSDKYKAFEVTDIREERY